MQGNAVKYQLISRGGPSKKQYGYTYQLVFDLLVLVWILLTRCAPHIHLGKQLSTTLTVFVECPILLSAYSACFANVIDSSC
jgi:hypothetical protein